MLLFFFNLFKLVAKEIKCFASLTFYLFSSTRLINSLKHEHSCKILYLGIILNSFLANGNLSPLLIFCKELGPRSGQTKCWSWSGSILFDTLIVFLKFFSSFWKKSADDKKIVKNCSACKELKVSSVWLKDLQKTYPQWSKLVVFPFSKAPGSQLMLPVRPGIFFFWNQN